VFNGSTGWHSIDFTVGWAFSLKRTYRRLSSASGRSPSATRSSALGAAIATLRES
jgi:hypothetical protein